MLPLRFGNVRLVLLLVVTVQWFMFTHAKTEDFVKAGKRFLEVLQKKNSEQDRRLEKIEGILNVKGLGKKNCTDKRDSQIQNLKKKFESLGDMLKSKLEKIEGILSASVTSGYGSKSNPGKSCKYILAANTSAVSGTYWIKPAVSTLFQVYCDMKTNGGGWSLVYSYTFTNYNSFTSGTNAVTPRPNWPVSTANVPISTTPSVNESSLGAVDWNFWKHIGQELMVKSNVNDWIVCQPNGGSLVAKKDGSMSCQNTKNVATACSGVAPSRIRWNAHGPFLSASSLYYYFDGYTGGDWPTHDPCGKNNGNHKKGVSNPGGQIYLR